MNLKQLKYVLVLSREGSFSRAAEVLHISQPSLSQYVKNIEKQIGERLFDRLNGEVRLTDAGRIYVDTGRRILDLEHQMEHQLSDLSSFNSGTVTVGISPYRSVHLIPDVFAAFDRLYPNVQLVIQERSGGELIEAAQRGEFDLCVIALPVDEDVFCVEKIHCEEVLIAVKRESELCQDLSKVAVRMDGRAFPAVDLTLLHGRSVAMLSESMPMRTVTDAMLKQYAVSVKEKIKVNSNETLLSVVESGVCAAFVPSGVTNRSNGSIAFFSIEQPTPSRDIAIVYRKQQYLSRPMQDLIGIFKGLS